MWPEREDNCRQDEWKHSIAAEEELEGNTLRIDRGEHHEDRRGGIEGADAGGSDGPCMLG